jgi:hypothetical protein
MSHLDPEHEVYKTSRPEDKLHLVTELPTRTRRSILKQGVLAGVLGAAIVYGASYFLGVPFGPVWAVGSFFLGFCYVVSDAKPEPNHREGRTVRFFYVLVRALGQILAELVLIAVFACVGIAVLHYYGIDIVDQRSGVNYSNKYVPAMFGKLYPARPSSRAPSN